MNISSYLFKLGCTTWAQDIITSVPNPGKAKFEVGKQLPTDIGFIYGISTVADGLDPDGNALITSAQAQQLYVTFQDGASQFLAQWRLDDLLNNMSGSLVDRADKFTPVNIPTFDISKSFYQNPNVFTTGVIRLKLWYIQMNDWVKIKKEFRFTVPNTTA